MRCTKFAALAALALAAPKARSETQANRLTPQEIEAGWLLLFDGETTFGWQATSDANWTVADGVLRADRGQPGWLMTTSEWADFELSLEFEATPATNSGVFLRTGLAPRDPASDCYELNIAPAELSPFATGSFVSRAKSALPAPASGWRRFDVRAEGGRFRVLLDGRLALVYDDVHPLRRGRIGLQFKDGPAAFRNVKLRPLGFVDLLGGAAEGLQAWRDPRGQEARFSPADDGTLHVSGGRGQLETQGLWADFVLQLEVRVNGRDLNSGVFFRNLPGEVWQGYESQIHNGFRDGDRARPADFGTGGIYRRQEARRIVADDGAWFVKTIAVSGAHMAVWVNGFQVSDWTDSRPPHDNPRQGLRRAAGTIALQSHDPTTDFDFRNIRIAELP